VQLLNITGGGGGGVIKEMSASLLKTLLGGDNAKYPVILDFSKGYMLNNDYFLASCPDIIKECVLHDLNSRERERERERGFPWGYSLMPCRVAYLQDQSVAQPTHRV
jgi:hypothetical protein